MKTSQFEDVLSLMRNRVIRILKSYSPTVPPETGDQAADATKQLCYQVRRAEVQQLVVVNLESLAKDLRLTPKQRAALDELFTQYRI